MPESKPKKRIEARVAQILNAKELVINVGSDHGVTHGQKFAILAESPIEIRDPETNMVLDSIDREKVRVEASEVRPRITICRTYRQFGSAFSALQSTKLVMEAMREARPETFRIEDDATPPPLTEEESYVKVNDRVRSVTE
ncbi:hypothetical protein V7x_54250 [Crateriforma conspicua]|uniref:Uncharacterized protein n=1 Tax=Crateriforma conspicua TaxID=2527996 RepID=A0A5C6FHY1_9PLAN|nr:hypothetical protein [Crateriforma conspicua]TWU61113.1 hypothetical protein V7x_54250 [Crateriforma conspicua]